MTQLFTPSELIVRDDSAMHAGHAGARPEGETHYKVEIVSPAFEGKSRVEMQRAVNSALKDEFDTGLHALSITARAG
ncbi:BolA family protein [Henriciella barbarensis]|uniref:BolA family protein n=1 Tax=Henriciella barbarensis TaxID=86342 RepID=UPI001F386A4D|nr:BolA family protein [Henriciella barbarensis]